MQAGSPTVTRCGSLALAHGTQPLLMRLVTCALTAATLKTCAVEQACWGESAVEVVVPGCMLGCTDICSGLGYTP